jgi:hypothetical protein
LGAGADATYNPEMLFDLVLVKLNEGNGKVVTPFMGEHIMAHRQREDALGMASEDKDAAIDVNTAAAAPAPAPKTKEKKT